MREDIKDLWALLKSTLSSPAPSSLKTLMTNYWIPTGKRDISVTRLYLWSLLFRWMGRFCAAGERRARCGYGAGRR